MHIGENETTTNLEFIPIAQVGDDGCGLSRAACSCLMPVLNWYNYKASLSLSLCLLFFLHNHIILCVWSLSTTCVFFRQLVLSNKVWYYKMLQCDQYYDSLSIFRKMNFYSLIPVGIFKWKLDQLQAHWFWKYWYAHFFSKEFNVYMVRHHLKWN